MISGNLCYDLTDHLPNFLIVCKLSSLPASTKVFRRDYSNLDRETLISDIQSINWNSLLKKSSDPSNMLTMFILSYQRLLIYTYLSSNYLNKISKLDQSHGLLLELEPPLELKNGLFKKFLKTKSIYYHTKFKIYRNKLNHLIKLAKKNYYNNFFSVHENNGKRIWYGIKQIVKVKTHVNEPVNKIVVDNCEIIDQESIANAFNEFFANIGSNLANSIPSACHLLFVIVFSSSDCK